MVFPSVPLYLDPPNWNQQGSTSIVINEGDAHHLPTPGRPTASSPAPQQAAAAAAGASASRPAYDQGSIAERTRLAKIPQTEAALKCPRCDSSNTKFCYFNNYSLTQPRHFCKTCRRYWTRGGALRSVPVGGGCRRNKRGNKPSSSKSSSTPSAPSSSAAFQTAPPSFVAPWHHALPDYGFDAPPQSMGLEQWRIQQVQHIPFLGAFGADPSALYSFEGELVGGHGKMMSTVKMEESSQAAANLPRQFFNVGRNDGQIWPGGGGDGGSGEGHGGRWISGEHLSGFSSSTGNFL